MYYFGYDPQAAKGHYCSICLREMFGESEICEKCEDRLTADEIEWED